MRLFQFIAQAVANHRARKLDAKQFDNLAAVRRLERKKQAALTPPRRFVTLVDYREGRARRALRIVNSGDN